MKNLIVAVVGRPNVGKSSLINALFDKKLVITSSKPQTTRDNIKAIYEDGEYQIIFVDTPGIHKPIEKMGDKLNKKAYFTMNEVDCILLLIDSSGDLGKGDKFVINKLNEFDKPVILGINKIDKIKKENILKKIEEYKDLYDFKEIVPFSALKNDNLDVLVDVLKSYSKEKEIDEEYFFVQEKKEEFLISEIIREKVIESTYDEIPYSTFCQVEKFINKKDKIIIDAFVVVDRKNLKGIIIGKRGENIKKIGSLARYDLEKMYDKKVFLNLLVKVDKDWKKNSFSN